MSDTLTKMEMRVQKLIAQAEGTDNPQEAATFMAAAEDLMMRYAIDRAKLENIDSGPKDEFVSISFEYPHAAMYWAIDKSSASVINNAIGLCGLAVTNSVKLLWLYGTKQDVEYTKTLILSVWKQQRRHMRLWKKTQPNVKAMTGPDLRSVEKGFYIGFAKGAGQKITESRQNVETETGGALVLASRMGEIHDFMRGEGVGKGRRGGARNFSHAGYSEGMVRGRDVSLGAELGGRRNAISR